MIELYNKDKTKLQQNYIDYSFKNYGCGGNTDTFVINNFVRDWGHLFIYDEKTLTDLFESMGFHSVKSYKLMESNDENLQGLENISRQPDGFLQLESFTLEATK